MSVCTNPPGCDELELLLLVDEVEEVLVVDDKLADDVEDEGVDTEEELWEALGVLEVETTELDIDVEVELYVVVVVDDFTDSAA